MLTIGLLLGLSFVVSLLALGFLIWAMSARQLRLEQEQAYAIFTPGEAGHADDASIPGPDPQSRAPDGGATAHHFDTLRGGIDRVSRSPVLALVASGLFWLVLGSIFGLMASMKLHMPDWLVGDAALTFGRVRTLHLNMVAYGWLSMTGIGVVIWMTGRMFHTALRMPRLVLAGTVLWNIMVAAGGLAIASGWTDGEEWLEIPWQLDIGLAIAGAMFAIPLVATAAKRNVHHIYVSGWYFMAALTDTPVLFIVANNRSYFNDEVHQERVARERGRPVENKWIGQKIDPVVDNAAIARAQGFEAFGPLEGEAAVRAALATARTSALWAFSC